MNLLFYQTVYMRIYENLLTVKSVQGVQGLDVRVSFFKLLSVWVCTEVRFLL